MTSERETLDLDSGTLQAQQEHAEALQKVEMKALANRLAVPTDDEEVKKSLNLLRHPIILFGENEADRRARLRQAMAEALVCANPDKDISELTGNEISELNDSTDLAETAVKRRKKDTFGVCKNKILFLYLNNLILIVIISLINIGILK